MFSRPALRVLSKFTRHFSVPARGKWLRRVLTRDGTADEPGLFGLPGLHESSDWKSVAEKCAKKCEKLADDIRAHNGPRDPSLLYKFDELSNELCIVLDTAELCRNVHPDPTFTRSAEQAYFAVSTVVQNLNADYRMYKPLAELYDSVCSNRGSNALRDDFCPEDLHMAKSLTLDFEKGGITLPAAKKKRLIDLQDDINRLSSEFTASANAAPGPVSIPRSKLHSIPKALHYLLKRSRTSPHLFMVPCDGNTVHALLRHVSNSETRELLYRNFYTFHMKQGLPILDSLLTARHELAGILGKKSYAEMQFEGRLASSPDEVQEFLHGFSKLATAKAQEEVVGLETIRNDLIGNNESGPLKDWDLPYYISRAKTAKIDVELRDMAQYLPLKACMDGIAW